MQYGRTPIFEGFDMVGCVSINSVANQPTSKAIIANEIIKSMNNHEKFFSVYSGISCHHNLFNSDGTVQANSNPCKNPCLVTGSSCARHVCKFSKCIEWNNYITDREKRNYNSHYNYVLPLTGKEYSQANELESHSKFMDGRASVQPPKTHKTCTAYDDRICEEYDESKCAIYQTEYKCDPLKNYKLTSRDLEKMTSSGYAYFKFAANIIPHLANHDIMIKNLIPSYTYYDLGSYDTSLLIPSDPSDINYNKLMTKMHSGMFYYNVGSCSGSGDGNGNTSVDDSVTDNDGYLLWILVDWIRYQDYHIKNFINADTSDNPLLN